MATLTHSSHTILVQPSKVAVLQACTLLNARRAARQATTPKGERPIMEGSSCADDVVGTEENPS